MEIIELCYRKPRVKLRVGDRVKIVAGDDKFTGVVITISDQYQYLDCEVKWDDGHRNTWHPHCSLKME